MIYFILLMSSLLALSGCKHTRAPDIDRPAVIVAPTDASLAALHGTLNKALGRDVLLSKQVLTDTSILLVEPQKRLSINGTSAHGRIVDAPVRFDLLVNGSTCILVQSQTQARYVLANTQCQPLHTRPDLTN